MSLGDGSLENSHPKAPASAGRLGAAIRRWREQRRLRHADSLERKITARANLRDFRQSTGDEPGNWMGGGG